MSHRLVFMGSDGIALPALEWIWSAGRSTGELVGAVTQPDRAAGRGQKLTANAIKAWAQVRGLPVLQPEKLSSEARAQLIALRPDAVLVMAYGKLLRQDWLEAAPRGVWNLHASLLPRFRGASPIQGVLAAGDPETGVSLMRMVLELDAGPVLDAERVTVAALETAATLEAKLAAACVPLLARNFAAIFAPAPPLHQQEEKRTNYTRRLRKEDGQLDFSAPADLLARRINALFPWPGTFVTWAGETMRFGLAQAQEETAATVAPGTVLASDRDSLRVACGTGTLEVLRLQRPGGRMLAAPEFLRGHPIAVGAVLPSTPMADLVAPRPFTG